MARRHASVPKALTYSCWAMWMVRVAGAVGRAAAAAVSEGEGTQGGTVVGDASSPKTATVLGYLSQTLVQLSRGVDGFELFCGDVSNGHGRGPSLIKYSKTHPRKPRVGTQNLRKKSRY
jgi:hypothetical protein